MKMSDTYKNFLGREIDSKDPYTKEIIKSKKDGKIPIQGNLAIYVTCITCIFLLEIFYFSIIQEILTDYKINSVTIILTYVIIILLYYGLLIKRSKIFVWWNIICGISGYLTILSRISNISFFGIIAVSNLLFIPSYFLLSRRVAITFNNKIKHGKKRTS